MTLSSEVAEVLVQSNSQTVPASDGLTEREREVLALMVEGLNNGEIAQRLVVSPSTVKFHIANIFDKLGVDNRVAAVTLALHGADLRITIPLPPSNRRGKPHPS